jgi:non-ribosomal peptide synthetase component F
MDTEPFHTTLHQPNADASYFAAPWLNSRTRKRVRDSRPSELQIHHDTVRRLFAAQRQDDTGMMMVDLEEPAQSFHEPYIVANDSAEQEAMVEEADVAIGVPEANQRSIHDFFARQKGKEPAEIASVDVHQTHELREQRSFGVLSSMNRSGSHGSLAGAAGDVFGNASPVAGMMAGAGPVMPVSCLPCDFRPAEAVVAIMEDAMVIG